jgi:hypothetical protein
MTSATAGSSQCQPPVARIIPPAMATPAAAAASAMLSSRTAATDRPRPLAPPSPSSRSAHPSRPLVLRWIGHVAGATFQPVSPPPRKRDGRSATILPITGHELMLLSPEPLLAAGCPAQQDSRRIPQNVRNGPAGTSRLAVKLRNVQLAAYLDVPGTGQCSNR